MSIYDVVVVGGRVAGASTAMLLARAGLSVALLDRSAYGTDTLSTHALMRPGVLQLSRWGLLDQLVAAGTPPVRRTTFYYPDADPVRVSIKPSAGVDALYAPRRHLLDRVLVDAAADAGAEVMHRSKVTALLRDRYDRVVGVRATGRAGERDIRAVMTVGADGVRSRVAHDAGASVVRQGKAAGAVLYRYLTGLPTDGYEWAYAGAAAAGMIPTNDGQTCVFVSTTPQRIRALRRHGSESAFRAVLASAAPSFAERVASAEPASRIHGWNGIPGFVRRSWGPGWSLVGDAGYFKDPITAHGITDALRDAELLTDEILEALAGVTPEAVALGRYQATRDRLSRSLFAATEEIAGYVWDTERAQVLLRQVSAAMSDELDYLQARPGHLESSVVRVGSTPQRT
jgi:flavin-dependent dehydrogenase